MIHLMYWTILLPLIGFMFNGIFGSKIKNEKLKPLYVKAKGALLGFKRWKVTHIPRDENIVADRLANESFKKKNSQ